MLFLAAVPFVLLATANSAGYRYGASDLAFYGPAVMRQLDPSLFPRDTPIIDAQARLTRMDETVAAIARLTTTDLPALFLALYLATLLLFVFGGAAVGSAIYRSRWTALVLPAALTLRHAITRSGTNSLEGYFHPRQLAFAFGILAVAAFLRARHAATILALIAAASLHPTTTLWFAIWLAAATWTAEPRLRWPIGGAAAAAALAGLWALTAGPLAGRLTVMDAEWLAALGEKDYLFPLRWRLSAWATNLAYVPVIIWIYRRRAAAGLTSVREGGLAAGCLLLVAVFAIGIALGAARVGLAIQLQPARTFWMLDFLATVYIVWAIAEGTGTLKLRRIAAAGLVLTSLSVARGVYVMKVEFPDRRLFETGVPGDWGEVTRWARQTPKSSGWLADPAHAARYGTSLRMAAARDVFVEGTKDAAIGMYDRSIALRTQDRLREIQDFNGLSAEAARALAREHDLDYLVSERDMALPIAYQAGTIRVYRLR
jgi:hypothetical protein